MTSLPTERSDWRLLGRTVGVALGHPTYAVLAILVGLFAALGMSVTRNLGFVIEVLLSDDLGIGFKFEFLLVSLPFLGPQTDALYGVLLYAIAAVTGAAVAVLAYHLVKHDRAGAAPETRDAAVVIGTLGAVCAACGPGIFAGILGVAGLLGGADVLANLPFEGLAVSLLAVVALVCSTFWLAEGMRGEIQGRSPTPAEPGAE